MLKHPTTDGPAGCCAACKSNPSCTAWKINTGDPNAICHLKKGPLTNPVQVGKDVVVGYTRAPAPPPTKGASVWSFGVSGDVLSVPAGFEQSTMLVHSPLGANAAWDSWGGIIRKAYNTVSWHQVQFVVDPDPYKC